MILETLASDVAEAAEDAEAAEEAEVEETEVVADVAEVAEDVKPGESLDPVAALQDDEEREEPLDSVISALDDDVGRESLDPVASLQDDDEKLSISTGSVPLPSSPQATKPTAKLASAPNKIKRFIPPPYFVMNYNKINPGLWRLGISSANIA